MARSCERQPQALVRQALQRRPPVDVIERNRFEPFLEAPQQAAPAPVHAPAAATPAVTDRSGHRQVTVLTPVGASSSAMGMSRVKYPTGREGQSRQNESREIPMADYRGARGALAVTPILLALVVGVAIGIVVGGLVFDDGDDDQSPPAGGTAVERVLDDPGEFGESTFVSGNVREIISPRAFTVASSFAGPELLVVTSDRLAAPTGREGTRPLLEGDPVDVIGEVRDFDLAEFQREVGGTLRREFDSFIGDDLGEREGEPAILADVTTFYSRTTPIAEASTAAEIATRPRDFYGRIVTLDGRISDVLQSGALIIDDEVIVLTAEFGQRRPRQGENVRITGPVRPFDPDQRRTRGNALPDDEIFGSFENRPAVVAQSIEIEG